jgi:hypothetical protein
LRTRATLNDVFARAAARKKTKAANKSFPACKVPSWKLTSANFRGGGGGGKTDGAAVVTLFSFSIQRVENYFVRVYECGAREPAGRVRGSCFSTFSRPLGIQHVCAQLLLGKNFSTT